MKIISLKYGSLYISIILVLLTPNSIKAQEGEYSGIFRTTSAGLMNSVESPAKGELRMIIGHRFGQLNGGFYEFFGLDQATMRLGFDWGATDWLGISTGRSTWEKTYDISAKASLIRIRENEFQFAAVILMGGSVNTLRGFYPEEEENLWSRSALFTQVLLAANHGRFSLQISPLFFNNNYDPRTESSFNLLSLPLAGSISVTKRMSLTGEYIIIFDKPWFSEVNPLTFSIDIDTGGHQFQLMFSNSQGLTPKTVLTNTDNTWMDGYIYFGFNLIRTFYL